jgi:Flp pilus assembly protein TadD
MVLPSAGRRLVLFLALLAVMLTIYQPAWHGQPVWDDDGHLTRAELQSADGLRRIWFQVGATQQYYPLVHSAFWLMHRMWGDHTTGYHLVNIALHASSAFLLAVLLWRLAIPGAVFAAFLFAVHPVQAESVAWMTELKNTLSTVLYLGAALWYLRFDDSRRARDWAVATLLFVLALLSKTVTATLLVSLPIVIWWKRGSLSWSRDARPLAPWLPLAVAAGVTTAWVERTFIGATGFEYDLTLIERVLLAARAVWFYLGSLVWPAHLVFIYPRWEIDQAVWWQYLPPLALGALMLGLWLIRHRTRAPLAALLLYGAALGPALGFVDVYPFRYSYVADHFQYAASLAALAFLAAWASQTAAARIPSRGVRHGLAAAALLPLGLLTWEHSHQYVNAETLYRTTIARNPQAWMALHNLAEMRVRGSGDDLQEALGLVRESLRINPDNAEARNTLGFALQRLGQRDDARREFERALQLNPSLSVAHNNLGVLAHGEGRREEAIARYQESSRLNPADPEPLRNLGLIYMEQGDLTGATRHFEAAYARNPDSADLLDDMGTAAIRQGRIEEAVARYRDALTRRPNSAPIRNNLGIALEKLGQLAEAEQQYREALRLAPDLARTHDNLGYVLWRQRKYPEAIASLLEAIRLQPDYPQPYATLAVALQNAGRLDESLDAYRRALAFPEHASDANLHNAYGVALAQRGRLTEAIAQFREALRLNPNQPDARANLARATGGSAR